MRLLFEDQIVSENASSNDSLARRYVRACASECLIGNVSTKMALLDTGAQQFPVSITDGNEPGDNCYVVSPQTAYSGYAREEIKRLGRPYLTWPLKLLTQAVECLLNAGKINKLVQVNNWLLSTNLYPDDWDVTELPTITALLRKNFPEHGIGFRSLNDFSNRVLRQCLQSHGYLSIPSRQVYLFDGLAGEQAPFLKHHNTRLDATLLRRSPYTIVSGSELNNDDFKRIEHLYNLLYLDKYCTLNPHYKAQWMQRGQREGWLEFRALRNAEGRIDGALGWFSSSTVISTPIVGYDTALPQRLGLYRQLTRLCLQEAAERRQVLNFSSGAAEFKRLRGGQPQIEYSLVYVAHLSWGRRLVWKVLSFLLHGIGVPMMRRLKL
ncbi:GNAT family N-acetyltransferase [Providencia alcalifaciens]|uniref:GNAT family N-acetyltransferase n=1 Tax=Providencia alcalifaciens TaxID=126385 RepID=UPI002B05F0FC|nr:GNAT family N-acetyltransferase [Providencia alcalifaciens]